MKRVLSNCSLPWTVLGVVLLLAGCRPHPTTLTPPIVVRYDLALPMTEAHVENVQTYLGNIRGATETDLGFKVSGILDLIGRTNSEDWREGAQVEAGEILAQLKQTDFESALRSAQAKEELERSRLDKNRKLYEVDNAQKAISQQEWETTVAGYEAAKAALSQTRQAWLDSTLRAPFKGVILARIANKGETLMPGRTVLRLGDLSEMSVELGVPEKAISRITLDQQIRFSIPALEETNVVGRVSEVGVAAKAGARLYKVVLNVKNPDGRLKSGMTASVSFQEELPLNKNAVLVPLSALVAASSAPAIGKPADGNALAVFVVGEDGRAHERRVRTDDIVRSSIMITDGLKTNEKVVVVGASMLYENALVDARPVEHMTRK